MGLLKWIGGLVAVLVLAGVGFFAYMGGFSKVEVAEGVYGPADIIFETHKGPYEKLAESWTRFQGNWEAAGLDACDALAVYLDPPGTPKEELRSIIACDVTALPEADKAALRAVFANMVLPESAALASSFPFKNFASYFLGPMKVYPEFTKRLNTMENAPHIAIETYGVMGDNDDIGFFMPTGVEKSAYRPLFEAF